VHVEAQASPVGVLQGLLATLEPNVLLLRFFLHYVDHKIRSACDFKFLE
jgi:hypothetical protein